MYTEWQHYGLKMLHSLESNCKVRCGYASIKNVSREASMADSGILVGATFHMHDHMPSFFLAETLKYLYLLFESDKKHWIDTGNFIFTTEGHILPINDTLWGRQNVKTSGEDGSKDAAQANNAKKRLRELQKFAHAKCLRTPPVMEYRVLCLAMLVGAEMAS